MINIKTFNELFLENNFQNTNSTQIITEACISELERKFDSVMQDMENDPDVIADPDNSKAVQDYATKLDELQDSIDKLKIKKNELEKSLYKIQEDLDKNKKSIQEHLKEKPTNPILNNLKHLRSEKIKMEKEAFKLKGKIWDLQYKETDTY